MEKVPYPPLEKPVFTAFAFLYAVPLGVACLYLALGNPLVGRFMTHEHRQASQLVVLIVGVGFALIAIAGGIYQDMRMQQAAANIGNIFKGM